MWKKILHKTNFDWCHLISDHKMSFCHGKPIVQTRDWHSYGHRPSSVLGKPLLSFFESKYIQHLICQGSQRVYQFHWTSGFIDDPCTINDDVEFSSSYKYIYPKHLELQLSQYATFLDLDITNEDNISFLTKGTSFFS